MAERELLVRIVGDDRDLQRALSNTERRVGQIDNRTATFGRNITRAFGAAGIAIGASEILRGAGAAVDAASAVNEEISKSRQIFGESSAAIEAWSTTTASAMGISQREALAATGTFGNLFRVVGIAPEQAGEMSRSFVQLAADLASFNNASPEDVLAAIRSGLIGEAEPLRRYGVLLSETRVQQVAMAETGKDNVKELTNQEKALARYKIILEDTAPAQGDFARTSDSLANKQRVAAAETADLAATIGKGLAPAMDVATIATIGLVGGLNDLIVGMGNLKTTIREGDFFEGFNEAVEDASTGVTGFFEDIRDGIPFMEEFMRLREGVISRADSGAPTGPQVPGPGGGIGADIARRAAEAARQTTRDALEADREQRRGRRAFDAFIKGMGLKFDKAELEAGLGQEINVLRELERGIQQRIEIEGKTFELVNQLTQVQLQRQSLVERQATDVQAATERAAAARKRAADAARKAAEEEREQERKLAELLVRRRQERQFQTLGLTATGEKRAPGLEALGRRAASLEEQVKGTILDTAKTRAQFDGIAKVLAEGPKKVKREMRLAILDMLNGIASALEGKGGGAGTTKFVKQGFKDIIEGIGLSPEEERALRDRLATLGPGGTAPGKGVGVFGFAAQPRTGTTVGAGQAPPLIIHNHVHLDGKEISTSTTKHQQKKRGQGSASRRGIRPGI